MKRTNRLWLTFALLAILLVPVAACTTPGVNSDGSATTQAQQTVAQQYSAYTAAVSAWTAYLALQKAGDPVVLAQIAAVDPARKAARAAIDRAALASPAKPDPTAGPAAASALAEFIGALARQRIPLKGQ